MPCYTTRCYWLFNLVCGSIFILCSIFLLAFQVAQIVIDNEVDKQLILSLDSPVFSQWVNPPPPIYLQYWIFNVTNPENITKGAKPSVKEIGPFTYRLYQPKTNVAFYSNDTASYKYNHTLVFQKDMSPFDPSLRLVQLNVPLLTVQSLAKNFPSWVPSDLVSLLADALDDSDVFVEHTVEELLFGYEDPIFKLVHDLLLLAKIDFPPQFGLFFGFNNSDDGVYLVNSGREDVSKANLVQKWNGNSTLTYWTTPEANMINGTDGTFMTPKINKSENQYIFNTDLCRSVYLTFERDTHVHGIATSRFELPAVVFANATVNPSNAGFCVPSGNCFDAGVLPVSSCREGAPVFVSSPHFYLGAKQYINGVNGLKPNKLYHETFLDIEAMTGAVFSGMKRLQVNVYLKDEGLLPQMKDIKKVMFPVVWLNESVLLDENSANLFKTQVLALVHFMYAVPYVIMALGFVFIMIGGGSILYIMKKNPKKESILHNEETFEESGDESN